MSYTFHVVSLPHTQTTKAYSACAFTEKVRKFCVMMKSLGHTVYLYASEDNEAPCDELITCITKQEQHDIIGVDGPDDILKSKFGSDEPHWKLMNHRAIAEIAKRARSEDFICIMGGLANKPIADAFPNMQTVEFGIGYPGTFAKYRVFESYAWMHTVYGETMTAGGARGNNYDRVINSYFEPEDFPYRAKPDRPPYFLFIGRLTPLKGYDIAIEVAKRMNIRLKVAGQGQVPTDPIVDYVGHVGPAERAVLFGGALATFVPTVYVEPFGSVCCESQMTGTPVITSDWGAFPELVDNGVTGFRCRTLADYMNAAANVGDLSRDVIAANAKKRWSTTTIRHQYQRYFDDLATLRGDGWYTLPEGREQHA